MNYLFFIIPFFVSLVVCLFLSKVKTNWFIDEPGLRKIHKNPTIRAGGIALYLAFISGFLLVETDRHYSNFIIISLTAFFIIGLLDDNYHFRGLIKFSFPFISSIIISWYYIHNFTFSGSLLVIIFISFWIFFNVNAFNLIDGIDGLCSIVCLLTITGLLILSIIEDISLVTIWSQIILSSVFAFYLFNKPPARIFLGDSGSHQIGLLVSMLTLFIFKENNEGVTLYDYFILDYILLFTLVFLIGYPNFDALYTSLTRIKNKRLPWIGDNNHPYHKFLKLDLSNNKILYIVNGIHLFFILSAFSFFYYERYFIYILGIDLLVVIYLVSLFESVEFERLRGSDSK